VTPAFLNVDRSLTGRRWIGPDADRLRRAAALAQQTGLPEEITTLLARAGIEAGAAPAFLAPTLRDLMPDPSSLRDMDAACDIVLGHMRGTGRIAIFADYDVDGAGSAALLVEWARALGREVTLYIPDRIDEGYGPNIPAMEALARDHDLIICVDCGTLSHAPIAAARAQGTDVVVLDHHLGGETLPEANAVVNPNRQDETSDLTGLCAAGVVFMLLVAMNRALRAAGQAGPDIMGLLDLVALATVADVAPLTGLNRALVRQGLKVMARRARPGLAVLSDVAKLRAAPTAYHLGFLLGPRINAGGRIGAADLGARLLTARDPNEAQALAERLDQLNSDRREIEAGVLAAATAQAEARGTDGPLVWAAGAGWHPGVVGIVAARLKQSFNRPAVVIGLEGETGKGSGRSVSGVDLGAAIATLAREGLLTKGGGHKMAAGLSLQTDRLEAAMARLGALLARQGAGAMGPADLHLDGLVSARAATPDLIAMLEDAGPFGAGAPAPRYAFAGLRVKQARRVGDSHLSLTFDDAGARLSAIAFRAFETDLGPALSAHAGAAFHVAGRLEIDDWGGRHRAKLTVEDAAPVT